MATEIHFPIEGDVAGARNSNDYKQAAALVVEFMFAASKFCGLDDKNQEQMFMEIRALIAEEFVLQ